MFSVSNGLRHRTEHYHSISWNGPGEIITCSDSNSDFQTNATKKFCMEETSLITPHLRGRLLDQARAGYP